MPLLYKPLLSGCPVTQTLQWILCQVGQYTTRTTEYSLWTVEWIENMDWMSKYVDYGLGAVKKAFINAKPPPTPPWAGEWREFLALPVKNGPLPTELKFRENTR